MFFRLPHIFLIRFSLILAAALYCVSCSARLDGVVYSGGRAEIMLKSTLLPNTSRLLNRFSATGSPDAAALNAAALNKAFTGIPGIESAALRNTAADSVEGRIIVSNMAEFLNRDPDVSSEKAHAAAVWKQSEYGGSFRLNLNMDTSHEFLSMISPELIDYLSALMAPAATGEVIDKKAYLELVSSVYGKAVAGEIQDAQILLYIDLPGPIDSISGGTYKDRHAEFSIPLIKLLVLDEPLIYEVRWTSWR